MNKLFLPNFYFLNFPSPCSLFLLFLHNSILTHKSLLANLNKINGVNAWKDDYKTEL